MSSQDSCGILPSNLSLPTGQNTNITSKIFGNNSERCIGCLFCIFDYLRTNLRVKDIRNAKNNNQKQFVSVTSAELPMRSGVCAEIQAEITSLAACHCNSFFVSQVRLLTIVLLALNPGILRL